MSSLIGSSLQCLFLLLLAAWEAATQSVARPSGFVRQGRSLTFPYGFGESYLEFTFGVGLPMNLPSPYQVSMSLEIRADYKYPVNASDFTDPTRRREEEEKEKEMEEMTKKEKQTKNVKAASEGQLSADVTQTRANGDGTRVEDSMLGSRNNTDSLKASWFRHGLGKDFSKLKFMKTEYGSNFKTGKMDNLTKTECYGEKPGAKTIKSQSKLTNKTCTYSKQKNVSSELKGVNANITQQSDTVGSQEERLNKTTSNAKEENSGGGARIIKKRDTRGKSTRWRIYHVLEMAANNVGMDGRACLLRSICDAAATPLHHRSNELVGELLHVLFTPSTTDDDRGRYLDNEYRAAERLGAQVGNNCELLYPECDVSLLDLITTFDLF